MKRIMKPIRIVAWSDEEGLWTPVRFQVEDSEEARVTIRVEKVLLRSEERTAGQRVINFRCRSTVDDRIRQYELCYELSTCRWYLSRW